MYIRSKYNSFNDIGIIEQCYLLLLITLYFHIKDKKKHRRGESIEKSFKD